MRIIILEDDSNRIKEFKKRLIGTISVFCTESIDCIKHLEEDPIYDYCFLDHDLGGLIYQNSGKGTGYEVAEWISNNPNKSPKNIIIHSLNLAGAKNMNLVLQSSGIVSQIVPGAWMMIDIK